VCVCVCVCVCVRCVCASEYLQPRIFQFKTNYWDVDEAKAQAAILRRTVEQWAASTQGRV
jgi:perosamine synthetase